jgi:Domain of Unknown Function (DUF1080)
MKNLIALALFSLAAPSLMRAVEPWMPLFNGRDFSGWETYLAAPPPETVVPGLRRDGNGKYLDPIGKDTDPLKVFTVTTADGGPVIHISGAGFGVLMSRESFSNFELRLQVRWGERKWGYKINAARDSGLLYFAKGPAGVDHATWPSCLEFQIQEHDFGDLFTLGATTVSAPARQEGRLWIYDPSGAPTQFVSRRPIGGRCARMADNEKPHGEWNTLELVCVGDRSVHVVNGKVVMRLNGAKLQEGATLVPLDSGRVCLQTEGAEVEFRDIEVRPIAAMPLEFAVP